MKYTVKKHIGGLAAVIMFAASPFVQAADYLIDTKGGHAAVAFKFKHLGVSWLSGEFKDFDGTFTYDEADPTASAVAVNIRTASIDSNHAERDKHMRSEKFLDTDSFPEASFVSKRVSMLEDGAMKVVGDLTLHGVTKEVSIDANVVGMGDDPWGGYRAGFEGSTVVDTMDFGMKFPPTNTVHMVLMLEGIRQ
jgi:polyisoprenoid-binding protein YceI